MPVRPQRERLPGRLDPARAALLVADDARPFALTGAWAGVAAIAGSEPLRVATPAEDAFALLDDVPQLAGPADDVVVGGGWFGWLGYGLGARVEAIPPGPPRGLRLPDAVLGFHDHVLVAEAEDLWFFEALWTEERADALAARCDELAARLAAAGAPQAAAARHAAPLGAVAVRPGAVARHEAAAGGAAPRDGGASGSRGGPGRPEARLRDVRLRAPGGSGHRAAVAEARERIAAGEIFQANLCLTLDARLEGTPAQAAVQLAEALRPVHGAFVAGPWGAVASASPELFLRRTGREVLTAPIKGTAPLGGASPATSEKDRAEHVMIVDLMRNDLGRVCEYGSVHVSALTDERPGAGVAHLVSDVRGTLRPGVGDGALLRATFPPGSVTGAPKVQALRVIAELEATGREAYTGALGYASPIAGLELSVVIRTLEVVGDRVQLGVGGGITSGSDPAAELEECRVKARPLLAALGAEWPAASPTRATRSPLPRALADGRRRPDPAAGVFETIRVQDGIPERLDRHLARLAASAAELYDLALPADLEERVRAAAADTLAARPAAAPPRARPVPGARLRVDPAAEADRVPGARLRVDLAAEADRTPGARSRVDPAAEADRTPGARSRVDPAAEADRTPGARSRVDPAAEADRTPGARLRVDLAADGTLAFTVGPLPAATRGPIRLVPVLLPGGLGAHKWRDRALLDALAADHGGVPLLIDGDGAVLEAAWASIWIEEAGALITPPADGRGLPGVARAVVLAERPGAREELVPLERLAAADAVWISTALRGLVPAGLL